VKVAKLDKIVLYCKKRLTTVWGYRCKEIQFTNYKFPKFLCTFFLIYLPIVTS
jgi:hypothetical protein